VAERAGLHAGRQRSRRSNTAESGGSARRSRNG
jgi:hypothetical protein